MKLEDTTKWRQVYRVQTFMAWYKHHHVKFFVSLIFDYFVFQYLIALQTE